MKNAELGIGGKKIGLEHPIFIIGEIAQAHDGSLGMAHAYIDAVSNAGADAIKFQTHIANEESSLEEPWRINFSYQDDTRYDYWKRMEFSEKQWAGLKKHADEKGLIFLSSPFSIKAMKLLRRIGIPAWKVASGEVNNTLILDFIGKTGLPIILSTGMSNLMEIDDLVKLFEKKKLGFALLQCTSLYPCPPEKIGINLISFFQDRYHCPVGLSDHSGKIYTGLAAASLSANMIEVHVTFSREAFGLDVSSSLTTSELRKLVEGIRYIEKIKANPVDKDLIYEEVSSLKKIFNRSIAYKISLKKGMVLNNKHLSLVKPGTGVSPKKLKHVIGKTLKKDVYEGYLLRLEDLEGLK